MAQSTQQVVVVARVSFESTRLSPQCLAETYAHIVPIARKTVRANIKAAPEAAGPVPIGRSDHG
jgi:hypothetical protein